MGEAFPPSFPFLPPPILLSFRLRHHISLRVSSPLILEQTRTDVDRAPVRSRTRATSVTMTCVETTKNVRLALPRKSGYFAPALHHTPHVPRFVWCHVSSNREELSTGVTTTMKWGEGGGVSTSIKNKESLLDVNRTSCFMPIWVFLVDAVPMHMYMNVKPARELQADPPILRTTRHTARHPLFLNILRPRPPLSITHNTGR